MLRTATPVRYSEKVLHGRAGASIHLRSSHLYTLSRDMNEALRIINGREFVAFSAAPKKPKPSKSKAALVHDFLRAHADRAFYSKQVWEGLKDQGVIMPDVMNAVRRLERKGLVYVRGYKTHDCMTPFRDGYLITWIEPQPDREKALAEAVERTTKAYSVTVPI